MNRAPDPAAGTFRGVAFDPFQRRAIEALQRGCSVIVSAPTGAGKTLIGEWMIEKALSEGRRVIYTAPIKAISNQKFRDFSGAHPGRVGIKTGDVSIDVGAPVLLMTTEIFRNMIFDDPESLADVEAVILDEIHFLDDIERGTVWEECIIFAPRRIRFLALSATVPNVDRVAAWMRHVRPWTPVEVVREDRRPVPLVHQVWVPGLGLKPLEELERAERPGGGAALKVRRDEGWVSKLVHHLRDTDRLPCIFFSFSRKDCEELALGMRIPLLSKERRGELLSEFERLCRAFRVDESAAAPLRQALSFGVCYHHAGLLPTLKEVVERLFTTGLVRILFATETFALGVNMPARSVVFSSLVKFDGRRRQRLRVREFSQMAGRAGRRGLDPVGYAYGVLEWPDMPAQELRELWEGRQEPIRSQFNLSYATILSLVSRLREKVEEAAEKSLTHFVEEGDSDARAKVRRLRAKIRVLREMGYLEGWEPTDRGRFASRIYGYELPISELYHAGILEEADEGELCALLCGVVFESRRGVYYAPPRARRHHRMAREAARVIDRILGAERRERLFYETPPADFRLWAAVLAWAGGAHFRDLSRFTDADPGDLVRTFRMTIQALRNTAEAVRDDSLRRRLRRAVALLNRGEVDAERQLRMSVAAADDGPARE